MFKYLALSILIWVNIYSSCNSCDTQCNSHSFFTPRDVTTNNLLQHNLTLYWWYRTILEDHNSFMTVQASPFYQRSTNGKEIARFFLPCNQSCATIKEDGTGDIGSLWLNLIAADASNFDGSFSIRPQRTLIGAYINIRINWKPKIGEHFWSDIAFAAMKSKHNIHLCESSNTPGVACNISSICQALNQNEWKFGKFCPETQSAYGVDNIEFKVGYDWYFLGEESIDHISPYFTVTAPTGKAGEATYLFEPVVGGKITGVGFGIIADYNIYAPDDNSECAILTDFKYLYGLTSRERRSFDLCKNGDWSRYLQVAQRNTPCTNLPGINLFTQEASITIRSRIDWWIALHYRYRNWSAEIGYDLWWQQKEHLTLCELPENFGIYDISGNCNCTPVSASCAHICQSIENNIAPSDPTFITLSLADININSGTMPRALTNSIYAAYGHDGHICTLSTLLGTGASYEFSVDQNALSNWTIWAKCSISY